MITDKRRTKQEKRNVQRYAGALQQRAACKAPLNEAAHVCLLMHVAAAQARTRLQERQRVSPAAQVIEACCSRVI